MAAPRSLLLSAGVHAGLLAVAAIALASTGALPVPRSITAVFTDVDVPVLEEMRPTEPEAPTVDRTDEEFDLLVETIEPELAYVSLEPAVDVGPVDAAGPASEATDVPWATPGAAVRVGPSRDRIADSAPLPVTARAATRPVPQPSHSSAVPQPGNAGPTYPSLARRRGWTGAVVLTIDVSESGEVVDVRIAESSGRDLLDRAAREAALAWRYEPAATDGVPVATTVRRTVRFELR